MSGQELQTLGAWAVIGITLAWIIGSMIRRAMDDLQERIDRVLAQTDADFAEHADLAIELARVPSEATLNHIARAMSAGIDDEWRDMNGNAS